MNDIDELKSNITAANKAYRDGTPIMSDQDFDDLCEQLESMVSKDEYSAFRDTLHEVKGKVKHPFIMGSLDKLKYEDSASVMKFIKESVTTCLNVSAKIDGISSRAHYENGKLVSLTSRGNGEFGESFNDKMLFIKHLPVEISMKESVDIRGELVICNDDFAEMNGYSNARNACAGVMNSKDWSKDDVSRISFIAYTILGDHYSKSEQFKILNGLGFKTAWSIDYTSAFYNKAGFVDQLFKDASQEFECTTDGLVICDATYKNEAKYRPDNCKAFKINQQVAVTRLVDVSWEGPSKGGLFIPVGIIDPIELGGAVVSRVTLHNVENLEATSIMYGSKVRVRRSGDVIPYLEAVVENPAGCTPVDVIDVCPCCGSKLIREGVNVKCTNKECSEQVLQKIVNFIKNIGVKSASNATLKKIGITSFKKLVDFVPNKKYKSEVKLADELAAKMFTRSKEDLLCNMTCFDGIGETILKKIISFMNAHGMQVENFMLSCDAGGYALNKNMKDILIERCGLPDGVGETTIDKFQDGLEEAYNNVILIVSDTRWRGPSASQLPEVKGSICVTGSLAFGSREKFLEHARLHGYEAKSGVSKGLTFLVNNDINSNSSKNRKAKELGIKIVTESEFMKMIRDGENESDVFEL
jgi:DNA ligase (NAD+)